MKSVRIEKAIATVVDATGHRIAICAAFAIIVGWAVVGPFVGYGTTWQLFINTATTIITFLMTFFIQNTSRREDRAVHAKLDEILRAVKDADDKDLVGVEKPDVDTDEAVARAEAKHAKGQRDKATCSACGEPLP